MNERDRRIAALAVPALGSLAIEPLYVLVDTAIVGRALGTVALGGLALSTTVLTTLMWVFNFLAYGTTARVAFLTGARDHRGAAGVAAQGMWLAVLIGVPLALVVGTAARPLAVFLGGDDPAVVEAAVTYLRVSAVGMPLVLVSLVGLGFSRGVADTRTPLVMVVASNAVNVVLEVLFVYGFDWGVAGSAWSTVIAQAGAAAGLVGVTARAVRRAESPLRPSPKEMRGLVVVGRHLFVRTGVMLMGMATATAMAAEVGPVTLAAHQIAFQITNLLALSIDGLAIAGQTMVGQSLGAADPDDARATGRRLIVIGVSVGAAIAVAVALTARLVPHVFTADDRVVERAGLALLLVAAYQVPGSVAWVLDGVLMGASDFRYLQWGSIAATATFAPFAVALFWHPSLGIAFIWLGMCVWVTARAAVNAARFRATKWTTVATA